MEKRLISGPELADLSGKSRQAINKNKKLPIVLDGGVKKYDLNDPMIQGYISGVKPEPKKPIEKKKVKPKAKKPAAKKTKTPPLAKKPAEIDPLDIPDTLKDLLDSGELTFEAAMNLTKTELEKIKIYEQIKASRLKTQKERENLVQVKLVKTLFSKYFEIDVNMMVPLKEKLIPDIAGIMGCNDEEAKADAGKKTDDHIWKILQSRKRVINDWLIKNGEEPINEN